MPAITIASQQAASGTVFSWDGQALATSGVVKVGQAQLIEVFGTNQSASVRYIQFFDAAAVPADTAIPAIAPIRVAAGTSFSLKLERPGIQFNAGLCWASSSTADAKTITVAADVLMTVRYI